MVVFKLDDGDPDGPVYAKSAQSLLANIEAGLANLEFFGVDNTYNIEIAAIEMTEEEFDALPEK